MKLYVIGHPSGLPTKVADGAQVCTQKGTHFSANLDTYGGNSGSAVFNAKTNEVVGILVRGANDYTYDMGRRCTISANALTLAVVGKMSRIFLILVEALKEVVFLFFLGFYGPQLIGKL